MEHELGVIGHCIASIEMLYNRYLQEVDLRNSFGGYAAFLVCSGPSLTSHNLELLNQPGITTLAVNNAATVIRPKLWTCVDDPGNFVDAIWRDPGILKFVPCESFEKKLVIRDSSGELKASEDTVGQMPAIMGYLRNEYFNADKWLNEKTFNWGNHGKRFDSYGNRGSRSVMYVAIKLLYYLGFRQINLLGCDFKMELGKKNYAFEQARSASSVRGNNKSYQILNSRLTQLLPYFEGAGLKIFNCTPQSGLKTFPYRDYEEAITQALENNKNPPQIFNAHIQSAESDYAQSNSPLNFTTIVGVDDEHCKELELTWPTWKQYRPQLLRRPLLLICDDQHSLEYWEKKLRFVDHPLKRLVTWGMQNASQREKMLSGLVFCAAKEVTTPWYLKLDTDAVALPSKDWMQQEWFKPDNQGNLPVFVSPPWSSTRNKEWFPILEQWGDGVPWVSASPRLNLKIDPNYDKVSHPRIISWCFFGQTAWTKKIAEACDHRLPVPSQDTFHWYCAERTKAYYVRKQMKEWWVHTKGLKRLRQACEQALGSPAARKCTSTCGVIYLLTGIKHAVRLAVSLNSLRQHYQGPVTVFSTQDDSHKIVEALAGDRRLNIQQIRIKAVERKKHSSFLTKVAILPHSPYETTLFLDADTLISGDISALFDAANKSGIAATQFADWTTQRPTMRKRVLQWKNVPQSIYTLEQYKDIIASALRNKPAINTGAFAITKNEQFLKTWWHFVDLGWDRYLVEETALQILLEKFPHSVLDHRYNHSPKYSTRIADPRIWHFHGDKHLRIEIARQVWWPAFQQCMSRNIGNILDWMPANDKYLKRQIRNLILAANGEFG